MNGKNFKLEKIDAVCEGNRFIDTDGIGLIINMSKIIQQIKIRRKKWLVVAVKYVEDM